jgi:hypothetical protein
MAVTFLTLLSIAKFSQETVYSNPAKHGSARHFQFCLSDNFKWLSNFSKHFSDAGFFFHF